MSFKEFTETIKASWQQNKDQTTPPTKSAESSRFKFNTRNVDSGHWKLVRHQKRQLLRWNTVIYSESAHLYEPVDEVLTTTQTLYYDLPQDKQKQLYRAYQELVVYMPWRDSPEE